MKPRKQTGIWKCKDGTRIRVCDMTDSHLLYSFRLVQRAAYQKYDHDLVSGYAALAMLRGEMATECAEQAMAEMESMDAFEYAAENWPQYQWLENEIKRRRLKILDPHSNKAVTIQNENAATRRNAHES